MQPTRDRALFRQKQANLLEHIACYGRWQCAYKRCVSGSPIQALQLIRQDSACDGQTIGYAHFEWVALDLAGNRAQQGQTDLGVIGERRQHHGRTASGLFVAGLRIEGEPYHIPAARRIG